MTIIIINDFYDEETTVASIKRVNEISPAEQVVFETKQ